jgi:hypothetical protein
MTMVRLDKRGLVHEDFHKFFQCNFSFIKVHKLQKVIGYANKT